MRRLEKFYLFIISLGDNFKHLFILLVRLYWGIQFFFSGRGKLMHFTQTVEFFQSLSIPFPYVNALTAASIECLGGILFAVGFASRLISIPLAFTMVIAYITAHSDSVKNLWENPENFTMQGPFNFLLATLIVFSFGPGVFSIDAFLKYFIVKRF